MKLLFLNTNIGYGGASKIMVWVANKCFEKGYEVTFLTYRIKEENQPLSSGVEHVHLQLENISGHGKGLLHTVSCLRQYIKEGQFDIAVSFLSPSHLRLALACKGLKTRILFSHRGDPSIKPLSWRGKLLSLVNGWAFRQADFFVFQTPMARDCFPTNIRKRSIIIGNPIVPLHRTQERKDRIEKKIVSVARLDIQQKRQDLLIKAFLKISKAYPEYSLDLYGDGPDEDMLRSIAKENEHIHFMGKTSNIVEAIQNAAMFVLSSDFEGIPNALLEAMSIGVPCISTDCTPGGAAMLIRNGENGLLVPRNDEEALAKAMEQFIENPQEREIIGKTGMNVNHIFSEDRIFEKWQQAINQITN